MKHPQLVVSYQLPVKEAISHQPSAVSKRTPWQMYVLPHMLIAMGTPV